MNHHPSNNFFEDGNPSDVPPQNGGSSDQGPALDHPDALTSPNDTKVAAAQHRRRRPRQSNVTLPGFDDELKEGTQIYNERSAVKPDYPRRKNGEVPAAEGRSSAEGRKTSSAAVMQSHGPVVDHQPRKIGSQ